MTPTVSSTVVTPLAPVPVYDATKIVVRQFRSEDLPQVIELFKEGMLCYPAQRENPRLLQFIDDSLETDLMDINGTYIDLGGNYWIATPSDEPTLVVGMVGLEAKPNNEGELRRMSVKSSHRRYGVGRMLLSTLEQWAEEHQFAKIWLATGSVMQKARDFYIRAGYIEIDQYFLPDDRPIYGVVKLEKVLASPSFVSASTL